jgi:DNA-binding response OmpR family regulator
MPTRIVIIEDEAMIAAFVEDVLIDHGFAVAGIAGSLLDANAFIEDSAFDIAIVDLNLRGQSTREIVVRLVESGKAVLVATGLHGLPQDFPDVPLLAKPFSPVKLIDMVRGLEAGLG